MHFLALEQLRKTYPDGTVAVKGIDLSIEEGEFIVLLGPSGCGKTTTLRMIAGLEIATGGKITLAGQDVTTLRRPSAMSDSSSSSTHLSPPERWRQHRVSPGQRRHTRRKCASVSKPSRAGWD